MAQDPSALTDVAGIAVGHWSNEPARTGCTVVLLPSGTVASGEVRGGAPGTREFDLLHPTRMVQHIDAVLLSGGSAFGLAAADGVMQWLSERGRGYRTRHALVPIVVGAVIYDLGVGSAAVRPSAEQGYLACEAASTEGHHVGRVGAGTGATTSKWRGPDAVQPGGLGAATIRSGELIVSALIIVNPMGDIVTGNEVHDGAAVAAAFAAPEAWNTVRQNTVIGVIATNAPLDKVGCHLVAQSGHDGIARAVWPSHLTGDGDALVAVSVPPHGQGQVGDRNGPDVAVDLVRTLASEAVAQAIRSVLT